MKRWRNSTPCSDIFCIRVHHGSRSFCETETETLIEMLAFVLIRGSGGSSEGFGGRVLEAAPIREAKDCGDLWYHMMKSLAGLLAKMGKRVVEGARLERFLR